uniref:Dynamin-A-like n=1 Tax=Dermatophagoides pteronyssinus TaxID=6956 RepID=A0A6P6XXJ7_DERPT|nr:dynamin-A-like [Dermatophagoides pteronyssinus]
MNCPIITSKLRWNGPIADFIENLPQLVMLGSQSVGKTSIIERIIGHIGIMPTGNGMVTRQPLHMRLCYAPNVEFVAVVSESASLPSLQDLESRNVTNKNYRVAQSTDEMRKHITAALKKNVWLDVKPLFVKIFSSKAPNLYLIDLPGLITIPADDQPDDLDEQIRNLILSYIKQSNSIIIAVSPANQDIANSESLKLARQVDPSGDRTLGVLSKYDLLGEDERQGKPRRQQAVDR